jgi:HNH endonuclease/NUMOD4 motif
MTQPTRRPGRRGALPPEAWDSSRGTPDPPTEGVRRISFRPPKGSPMPDREEWRPVPEFWGYEVSNLGRVRTWRQVNLRSCKVRSKPLDITPTVNKDGYLHVSLGTGRRGRQKKALVHRLVLEVFGGNGNGYEADHVNGDKTDNRLANLEWVTGAENTRRYRARVGLSPA